MKRILLPTSGPCSWRALLADPNKHWKRGRSALEAALSWESAQHPLEGRGFPAEVASLLDGSQDLRAACLILAIPEHQVRLDTGKAPSQNDVWALLRNERGLISMTVEAKAGEPFDDPVAKWLEKGKKTSGRPARLNWLCERLKSSDATEARDHLGYQLLHRTASALIAMTIARAG